MAESVCEDGLESASEVSELESTIPVEVAQSWHEEALQ